VCSPSWFSVRDANGAARWPSVQVELLFNLAALLAILFARRHRFLSGQLFHFYLIAYGAFRFLHEFLRDDPRLIGPFTGYHIAALVLVAFGAKCFLDRRSADVAPLTRQVW